MFNKKDKAEEEISEVAFEDLEPTELSAAYHKPSNVRIIMDSCADFAPSCTTPPLQLLLVITLRSLSVLQNRAHQRCIFALLLRSLHPTIQLSKQQIW